MKAKDIVQLLDATTLGIWNENLMNKDYNYVFATDLMSDALARINNSCDTTVLLTGLCNAQSLRTAEMLDLEIIIYVHGKTLDESVLNLAMEMGFNVFSTEYSMFEACGILYQTGLKESD